MTAVSSALVPGTKAHPKLRCEVLRVGLVDLLAAGHDVLELIHVRLVDGLFERVVRFVLVRLKGREVLRDFLITVRQL